MKQITRYDCYCHLQRFHSSTLVCMSEDVEHLEKENKELRKYKNGWKRLDKLINGILSDLIVGKITDNEAIMMQVCTKIRDHYRQIEKELGI